MSAGTGIRHSEFNASDSEPVHFLQIWVMPDRRGHEPGYEQKTFGRTEKEGRLRLVASPDGRDGSVSINQDALLYASCLKRGTELSHVLGDGRVAWAQVARGSLELNGETLHEGDGVAITGAGEIKLGGTGDAEVLLFDMTA